MWSDTSLCTRNYARIAALACVFPHWPPNIAEVLNTQPRPALCAFVERSEQALEEDKKLTLAGQSVWQVFEAERSHLIAPQPRFDGYS
jgi:hypothetical protein